MVESSLLNDITVPRDEMREVYIDSSKVPQLSPTVQKHASSDQLEILNCL